MASFVSFENIRRTKTIITQPAGPAQVPIHAAARGDRRRGAAVHLAGPSEVRARARAGAGTAAAAAAAAGPGGRPRAAQLGAVVGPALREALEAGLRQAAGKRGGGAGRLGQQEEADLGGADRRLRSQAPQVQERCVRARGETFPTPFPANVRIALKCWA